MKFRHYMYWLAIVFQIFGFNFAFAQQNLSTIKHRMIEESLSHYPGNCPCPYNLASNGSQCGRRSAYSRPGGYEPLCYESDISDEQAIEWARKHRD